LAGTSIKKNTVYNAIKTISSIIFPVITFPYISRVLLPDYLGKINFGLSIVSYFTLLATLGITTYAIRECSAARDNKEKLSDTASQIYSINIVTTIIAYLFLAVTLIFCGKLRNYRLLIVIQSLSIVASTLGADWINSAMEDFKFITLRTISFQFISLILMFMFVHKPEDYIKYTVISLVSSAGANIVNIWYRRRYCNIRMIWDLNNGIEWKRHMTPILYLFVMLLAHTIFNSVDSTMLGLMHGDYEVGIYSTANKMFNLVSQLISSLLWVILPRMSYYFSEGNYDKINKLLRKILAFNALLGLPLAVGTYMLSKDIILIISGDKYIDSAEVLQILMVSLIFTLFGGDFLGNSILLPAKKEKSFMMICCITAIVNVIMNYVFIPLYGAKAAAGTTTFCAFLMMIMLYLIVDKRIKIVRLSYVMITPLIGCLGIILICLGCTIIDNLWLRASTSIILSVITYGIIVILGRNELVLELILSFKQKIAGIKGAKMS